MVVVVVGCNHLVVAGGGCQAAAALGSAEVRNARRRQAQGSHAAQHPEKHPPARRCDSGGGGCATFFAHISLRGSRKRRAGRLQPRDCRRGALNVHCCRIQGMLVQALPMSPTGHVVVPHVVADGQCGARCLVAACMVPAVRPSCSELPKGGVGARWHRVQHTTTPQQPPHTASTPRTRVLTSVSIGETTACGAAASGLRDAAAVDLQLQQHTVPFFYAADDDWLPVWRLEPGCALHL